MTFQWIVDNAQDIIIERSGTVGQTIARDQTVRAVNRGNKVWKFTVTPSPGKRWADTGVRAYMELIQTANRYTPSSINFAATGQAYLFGYQGNNTGNGTNWNASVTQGASSFTFSGTSPGSGYKFKTGDIIQLANTGPVYVVTADVAYNSSTVPVHRPILQTTGTYNNMNVGQACSFSVICTNLPTYKITPLGIIEWSGPFEFVEVF